LLLQASHLNDAFKAQPQSTWEPRRLQCERGHRPLAARRLKSRMAWATWRTCAQWTSCPRRSPRPSCRTRATSRWRSGWVLRARSPCLSRPTASPKWPRRRSSSRRPRRPAPTFPATPTWRTTTATGPSRPPKRFSTTLSGRQRTNFRPWSSYVQLFIPVVFYFYLVLLFHHFTLGFIVVLI